MAREEVSDAVFCGYLTTEAKAQRAQQDARQAGCILPVVKLTKQGLISYRDQ
ncbi:hypothetical protein BN4901_0644 [Citrobacter europaeus]|uniref:Uncharacterized protein n=1 Tax=Citrobacter europaeus TaxID=1914243 RepID=A0ABY0JX47_9ENTR|nr:hypothetical protein BN4901_0644 [Citrobacter europaeus]